MPSVGAFIRMMILFWRHGDVLEPILEKLPQTLPKIGDELKKSGKFTSDVSKTLMDDGGENSISAEKISKQVADILDTTVFPPVSLPAHLNSLGGGPKTALGWAAFTLREAATSIKIEVPVGVTMNMVPDVTKMPNPFDLRFTKAVPTPLNKVSEMLTITAYVLEQLESNTVDLMKGTVGTMNNLGNTFGDTGRLLYKTGNYMYCAGKIFRLEPPLSNDEMQCPPP